MLQLKGCSYVWPFQTANFSQFIHRTLVQSAHFVCFYADNILRATLKKLFKKYQTLEFIKVFRLQWETLLFVCIIIQVFRFQRKEDIK